MWEPLPETRQQEAAQSSACCHSRCPKCGLITDIALWTECFTTLAAALSAHYPDKAPHFMAYLRTIVRASRNFEGPAWASYDAAYRRQAANNRSLDWAIPDPALYNEAFTGRARVIPRCQFCLSDSHSSHDCTFDPDTTRTGNHPPDVGQSGLIPLKSAACLISQGAASAALNSAGMHIYVPGATGHTQCRSATGTSSTIPGQPHLRARRGKQTGRLPLSSSYAKLIWGPSPIDPAAFLLILLPCVCLDYQLPPINREPTTSSPPFGVIAHFLGVRHVIQPLVPIQDIIAIWMTYKRFKVLLHCREPISQLSCRPLAPHFGIISWPGS